MRVEAKKILSTLEGKDLCLHASSVNVSGKALLFLGHSTAGKSTISQLLSGRYPVIADDKVWIHQRKNGNWMVRDACNNPCEEKSHRHLLSRKRYPLLGVLRIFKAKSTQIYPISKKETCKYLMDAVFEIDFQRKVDDFRKKKDWFSCVAEISRKIEGWRLTFKKDESIIDVIHEKFKE